MNTLLSTESIKQRIYFVRESRVILDSDLAVFFEIPTYRLNQQVKRNPERFPGGCVFKLTKKEFDSIQSTLNQADHGGRRYLPYAFTEQGVLFASTIINSEKAIYAGYVISKALIQVRNSHVNMDEVKCYNSSYDSEGKSIMEQTKQLAELNRQMAEQNRLLVEQNKLMFQALTNSQYSGEKDVTGSERQNVHLLNCQAKGQIEKQAQRILENVASFYGVKNKELFQQNRKRQFVVPRHIAIFLIKKHTTLTLSQIGSIFAGRDHTTILHACDKIASQLNDGSDTQKVIESIERSLFPSGESSVVGSASPPDSIDSLESE